jgi:hypothetical protein
VALITPKLNEINGIPTWGPPLYFAKLTIPFLGRDTSVVYILIYLVSQVFQVRIVTLPIEINGRPFVLEYYRRSHKGIFLNCICCVMSSFSLPLIFR